MMIAVEYCTIVSNYLVWLEMRYHLMTTSEYTKYTMRGGKDISMMIGQILLKQQKLRGLTPLMHLNTALVKLKRSTLLMPNAFGGDSTNIIDENSNCN